MHCTRRTLNSLYGDAVLMARKLLRSKKAENFFPFKDVVIHAQATRRLNNKCVAHGIYVLGEVDYIELLHAKPCKSSKVSAELYSYFLASTLIHEYVHARIQVGAIIPKRRTHNRITAKRCIAYHSHSRELEPLAIGIDYWQYLIPKLSVAQALKLILLHHYEDALLQKIVGNTILINKVTRKLTKIRNAF